MTLIVPHVDIVKAALGETAIQALSLIFASSSGIPPGTPLTRFRADHPELMDNLDKLGWAGLFLKRDDTKKEYRISGCALPLVDSPRTVQLVECMSEAYKFMQTYYKEHLGEQLLTKSLISAIGIKKEIALEALCYMQDIGGWWNSLSHEFPSGEASSFCVNEQVLVHQSFVDLLARIYEWEYVNPKNKASTVSNLLGLGSGGISSGFFSRSGSAEYPEWYEELDDKKKALLSEIDVSMRNDLSGLPMMGMRALLEGVMIEHVGDCGSFERNIDKFEKNGFITSQHANILRKVLDAGSASMHRTYFPNVADLGTCVEVVKHLLHGVYVLHPKVQDLAANTPPRPKPISN